MKKLTVGCDLFLDLKLYQLPQDCVKSLTAEFPDLDIQPVNLKDGNPRPPSDLEIYWGNRITPEIIAALPRLKWIHFGSVGVNRAQTPEVVERKITVTNSRDVMTGAVAASALALMLSLARGLHHCWRLQQEGNLARESYDRYFHETQELEGQTCLIVGYGQIGRRLADVCAALKMRVDVVARSSELQGVNGKSYKLSQLKEAVKNADYVVNLLPLTSLTAKIFDRAVFASMRRNCLFVNVGRGETVCEADLIAALKNRDIAGAGLDVFEKEPLAKTSELWNIPEVIITPHIAGLTNRYWEKETKLFADNLRRYRRGEELLNVVDMGRGY